MEVQETKGHSLGETPLGSSIREGFRSSSEPLPLRTSAEQSDADHSAIAEIHAISLKQLSKIEADDDPSAWDGCSPSHRLVHLKTGRSPDT